MILTAPASEGKIISHSRILMQTVSGLVNDGSVSWIFDFVMVCIAMRLQCSHTLNTEF